MAPRLDPLPRQVLRTARRAAMLAPGDRVLVAISGGPDSTALLAALVELRQLLNVSIVAAHVNHRLRGAESARDEMTAAATARELDVPFAVDICPGLGAGASLEARARRYRYEALQRLCGEHGCKKIATGHTRDDQVETIVLRLVRGTGTRGFAGIRSLRDDGVVRPLLDCSREQVMQFLSMRPLPWVHDSSNESREFLRNRVRHEILPLLRQFNPAFDAVLVENAATMAGESEWLDHLLGQLSASRRLSRAKPLSIEELMAVPAALRARFVRLWLELELGSLSDIDACHVQSVLRLAAGSKPSGEAALPRGTAILREYGVLRCTVSHDEETFLPVTILPDVPLTLGNGWRFACHRRHWHGRRPEDSWTFVADAERVGGDLVVRPWRTGDRLAISGGGHRKVQDIFVDAKIPRRRRRTYPIVECAGAILWVPGVARSSEALLTRSSEKVIEVVATPSWNREAAVAGVEPLC